jgi:hypothetical protein
MNIGKAISYLVRLTLIAGAILRYLRPLVLLVAG